MARKKKETTSETKIEVIKTPKQVGPYDIIKLMFTDIKGFDNLSKIMLERNAFMINRVFSIQFPEQAQCFNKTTTSLSDLVKMWRLFAVKALGFGKVPSFVYTKGAKQSNVIKEKENNISKEIKDAYCLHYGLSLKDFDDLLLFNHDELLKDIDLFHKITSHIDLTKKTK